MSESNAAKGRCFIDTNIWLYAFIASGNRQKNTIAKMVVQNPDVVVSTQVINETCVNLLKQQTLTETNIQQLIAAFYEKYTVVNLEKAILLKSSRLRTQYSLSYWDSLIVAAALHTECTTLYTEDMHSGLEIEQSLTIFNPFE